MPEETKEYKVLQNRMISHAGVNYAPGDVVKLTPQKAKLHLDGKNIEPIESAPVTPATTVTPPKESKTPSK